MIDVSTLKFRRLVRTRKVNGESTISLDVFPTADNKDYFDALVEEVEVSVDGEIYVIKKITEKSIGNTYWKQATGVHKFYVDLINSQQTNVYDGSITFKNYMEFVLGDTPYSNFDIVDHFDARSFENLGNDNRLALLKKGLDRFRAELELVGSNYRPRFRKMVGNDTDFQFRYGHNIKSITKEVDTTNLATRIKGKGAEGIEAEYISPNADIFGIIDAPSVNDERITSESSLLEELRARLQDEPLVSITIDFVDLRQAGYPYTVPNEGDRVFVIYEPMEGLEIETRILDIVEEYNANMENVKTSVTLSNHKKSFAETMFENTQKQLSDIVDDDGIVKYSVLDDAIKNATQAIKNARTQLEFPDSGGILARSKKDPNRVVIYNSEGIAISNDGGQTVDEAITSDGFVLTAGAVGKLSANHVDIKGDLFVDDGNVYIANGVITNDMLAERIRASSITIGQGTDFEDGYDPTEIMIGGRNYLSESTSSNLIPSTGGYLTNLRDSWSYWARVTPGETYTVSRSNRNNNRFRIVFLNEEPKRGLEYLNILSRDDEDVVTFEVPDDVTYVLIYLQYDTPVPGEKPKVKLEKGNKATDWTPAPEDMAVGTYIDENGVYTGTVIANQITSGTLDADRVTIRSARGKQEVRIDDTGLVSRDNDGNVRIHLGIRNISGKGQSDPSMIRFFSGSGSKSASIGMNVNDHFIIGSDQDDVFMELRTKERAIHYAREIRFVVGAVHDHYFRLGRLITGGDSNYNPGLRPDTSGKGYLGTSSYRLWRAYVNHLHYFEQHKLSQRDWKRNIRELSPEDAQRIFDEIELRKFNYKRDGTGEIPASTIKESYGAILDEVPEEIKSEDGEAINQDNFIAVIAGALKYQQKRIDQLEKILGGN